jgi:transcription termination/antitermination protein NusA
MFDLKVINSVLNELEEERGIPRDIVLEAIGTALASAYKKEHGEKGQVVRAKFDISTGTVDFSQVKFVVDEERVYFPKIDEEGHYIPEERAEDDERVRFDPEKHMLLKDAKMLKKNAEVDDEIVFPLETHEDFGRIAAQTAKQVIIQKIREAEKVSVLGDYETKEGEIISGTVQRTERGNIFLDLGRAVAILPYDEQIPGERFRQGERVRAYLCNVEEGARGVMLRVSRSHPRFLIKLFEQETPELSSGAIRIRAVAREPGSRSKVAVEAVDSHIDPVGALVGQRGVRVSTVMSELGGEKIDIIEWSEEPAHFVEDALSPAKVLDVVVFEDEHKAQVEVAEDQQSLAIGRGGQNVRLAAKLTGWRIDIQSIKGDSVAESDEGGDVVIKEEESAIPKENEEEEQIKEEKEKGEKKEKITIIPLAQKEGEEQMKEEKE